MFRRSRSLFVQSKHYAKLHQQCLFSTSFSQRQSYDLVVVGGGSGGCAAAAKFSAKLGKGKVAVIDPAEEHYYQPMFTLIGGGMKQLHDSSRKMKEVLPPNADWIQEKCVSFDPDNNKVVTGEGREISYNFLVVALGLQLDYDKVPGLLPALNTAGNGVCSNYSPLYVDKTFDALKRFEGGNAVFTLPNTPIKCPGAPQKIVYIAEEYLRKTGKRANSRILYHTSLGVLFGVKKYADSLWQIVKYRDIDVTLRSNLIEVKPDSNVAVFQDLDNPENITEVEYSMLHAAPPMSTPDVLRGNRQLADAAGFLNVSKETLQHASYPNIFGLGDCTNTPNAKTAAAVAGQVGVLYKNLKKVMKGETPTKTYKGYTSCPLVTGYNKCILAEFDYTMQPLETFPINQGVERRTMFHMKKDFMPPMYWHGFLKGHWNGPETMRSLLHLGMK